MSEMRSAPLPPTWAVVEPATTTQAGKTNSAQSPSPRGGVNAPVSPLASSSASAAALSVPIEYVNRVTGERTSRHPGTSYFLALVESERSRRKGCGGALLPPPGTDLMVGPLHQQHHQSTGSLRQSTQHNEHSDHEHGHAGSSISTVNSSKSMNDIMEGGTHWDIRSTRSGASNGPCPLFTRDHIVTKPTYRSGASNGQCPLFTGDHSNYCCRNQYC